MAFMDVIFVTMLVVVLTKTKAQNHILELKISILITQWLQHQTVL